MRLKFITENGPFPKCATSVLESIRTPRSQAKIHLYSAPEARCTYSPSFFYRGGTSRGRAMEGDQEPAGEAGAGDGKLKRVTITDKTQVGNMKGFFPQPVPGREGAVRAAPTEAEGYITNTIGISQRITGGLRRNGPGAGTDGARNSRTSSRQRTIRTIQRSAGNGTRHGHRRTGELVDERSQHLGVPTQSERQLITSSKASITSMGENERRRNTGSTLPRPSGTSGGPTAARHGSDRVQSVDDHAEPITGLGVGDGRSNTARQRIASKHYRENTVQTTGAQSKGLYHSVRRHSDAGGRERRDTERHTTVEGARHTGIRWPTQGIRGATGKSPITIASSGSDTDARDGQPDGGGSRRAARAGLVIRHNGTER